MRIDENNLYIYILANTYSLKLIFIYKYISKCYIIIIYIIYLKNIYYYMYK